MEVAGTEEEIRVICPLHEYVLDREELGKYRRMVPASPSDPGYDPEAMPSLRASDKRDNIPHFKADVGKLMTLYPNTYVAYVDGVLCGQSSYGQALYEIATTVHECAGIQIFRVPELGKFKSVEEFYPRKK